MWDTSSSGRRHFFIFASSRWFFCTEHVQWLGHLKMFPSLLIAQVLGGFKSFKLFKYLTTKGVLTITRESCHHISMFAMLPNNSPFCSDPTSALTEWYRKNTLTFPWENYRVHSDMVTGELRLGAEMYNPAKIHSAALALQCCSSNDMLYLLRGGKHAASGHQIFPHNPPQKILTSCFST